MKRYFYITYMVHNNLHSTIAETDASETFSDITAKCNTFYGHAICIICAHETTREDYLKWDKLMDKWEVKK